MQTDTFYNIKEKRQIKKKKIIKKGKSVLYKIKFQHNIPINIFQTSIYFKDLIRINIKGFENFKIKKPNK